MSRRKSPRRQALSLAPGVPRAKYPMLFHTRPGGINGMLEILYDRDGHDDIYHLADDLAFEIDDVLPYRQHHRCWPGIA